MNLKKSKILFVLAIIGIILIMIPSSFAANDTVSSTTNTDLETNSISIESNNIIEDSLKEVNSINNLENNLNQKDENNEINDDLVSNYKENNHNFESDSNNNVNYEMDFISTVENTEELEDHVSSYTESSGTFTELKSAIENTPNNGTLVLTKNYTYNPGDGIQGRITFDKSITIDGNGYTIDCAKDGRFYIHPDDITLKNLKIINSESNTAVIFFDGDNGNIINCTFINNTSPEGGAIYWESNLGTITNSTFINNTSPKGGAIYWNNGVSGIIINSTFINNSASSNGGAVYWYGGLSGKIISSTFINNSASSNGGAIYWHYYDGGTVNYCAFINNTAPAENSVYVRNDLNCNYNWWGNNTINSSSTNKVPEIYAILNFTADPTNITLGESVNLTGKFYWNGTTDQTKISDIPIRTGFLSNNGTIINDSERKLENGVYTYTVTPTTSGKYKIDLTVDTQVLSSEIDVKLNPTDLIITIDPNEIDLGTNSTINITVVGTNGTPITGTVTVKINNSEYNITLVDGKASLNIGDNLSIGIYNITAKYNGDSSYSSKENNTGAILTINKIKTILTAENTTTYVSSDEKFTAILKDQNGNPIANKTITLTLINNQGTSKNYTTTTDIEGKVQLDLNLKVGNYTFNGTFQGDNQYQNSNFTNISLTITKINTVLIVENTTYSTKSGENYTIKLTDENGNALVGYKVGITLINNQGESKTYYRVTNIEGEAKLVINLAQAGNYTINASFEGNENYTAAIANGTITIMSNDTVLTGPNMTTNRLSGENYTVTLKDQNGNVLAGRELTITLVNDKGENKTYWRTTNTLGEAKLAINLAQPLTYYLISNFPGDNNTAKSNTVNATLIITAVSLPTQTAPVSNLGTAIVKNLIK